MEICGWLYNRLLGEIERARKEGRKITQKDTQALIVKLKGENLELKKVYSKVLQMVKGRKIENPKFYDKMLRRIKGLHKNLSRKKKGSKNREKTRKKLAVAYEKLNNKRRNFLHKLSRFYVDNYDFIAVEDLKIRNMIRNRHLARSIQDASWGEFMEMLSYKAEGAGKIVKKVNPRGTSEGLSMDDPYRD